MYMHIVNAKYGLRIFVDPPILICRVKSITKSEDRREISAAAEDKMQTGANQTHPRPIEGGGFNLRTPSRRGGVKF